jgi:hypothetical protein
MTVLLDASRGSVLWAINHFRKDGLQALVNDLRALDERGLTQKECSKVQDALSDVVTVAAAVPAGTYWETNVYGELERFQEAYVLWNAHGAERVTERRADLARLRKRKIAISRRIAQHQGVLRAILQIGMVVEMYQALERIASEMPALFPKLAAAVKRFRIGLAR